MVLNREAIGSHCIVGANRLITEGKRFPDNSQIVGSPARVVRELREEERALLAASALHYVENWRRYARDLRAREG